MSKKAASHSYGHPRSPQGLHRTTRSYYTVYSIITSNKKNRTLVLINRTFYLFFSLDGSSDQAGISERMPK
ncbi:hypothetical protein JOC95_002378 [Bacillus tianshenii]|uniref:Uncharacterized protein n=1 Tax=Sutcliffiella tianshenii TaxID=1463404 RepID=A0ABS2P266_9BACI|nr:hypothetical protein [Bacillus tianshenii]